MAMGNVNNIDDDMTPEFVLFIYTESDAQTQGRRFVVEFNDIDQRSEWHSLLTTSVAAAKDEHFRAMHPGRAALLRKRCREVYTSAAMQAFVGVVIVASFCTAIAESQIIPTKGSRVARQFFLIEVVFTAIFVVELGLNMYAHWLREFLDSRANIFDTCVVLVSIISLSDDSIPGVNVLRLFRIFRMVRVFRSLTHLRILVTALSNSIVPVLYSFMLLGLVMSIYAVISTDFFREVDPENWGDFFTSLFSLFQVATGDSWASVLTHDLVHAGSDISPAVIRTFFVSFVPECRRRDDMRGLRADGGDANAAVHQQEDRSGDVPHGGRGQRLGAVYPVAGAAYPHGQHARPDAAKRGTARGPECSHQSAG